MEQSVQELCWLIQEALYEKRHDFTITDSERLFHIAKENGLSGTVFEVVQQHGISQDIYKKFQREFFLYVAQDEAQLRMIDLIKGLLDANGIQYRFLKGSTLKHIYPQTFMRAMGDIDFLVQEKDKKKSHELLERVGVNLQSKGFVHDYYVSESGLKVEMHIRLTKEKKEYPDLEREEDIIQSSKGHLELELLYLLYHLKKHLITSGIGIRSVIDIGVFIHHHMDDLDFELLDNMLVNNNLKMLYDNVLLFNKKYLGDELFEGLSISHTINPSLFESFTTYIVLSGVHGWGISFNHFSGVISAEKGKRFRRIRYLLKITFFSYNDLRYIYPRLLKTRLLLPIAWMLRVFNLLFKNRQRRQQRLKQLFDDDVQKNDVSYMFEELGI